MSLLQRRGASLVLALVAVTGLLYDAKVHVSLAGNYDAIGSTITQGGLFRVEAAVAVLAALALVVSDHRMVWAAAGVVGLGGVAAVLLYRYVDVGAIGPIPDMYEPVWFPEKLHSAYAEGLVAVAWLVREAARGRTRP